jgi:16S rRNA (guanine1516-N2)-methyltransferase
MPDLVVARAADPERAATLAVRLGLPLVDDARAAAADLALRYEAGRLTLGRSGPRVLRPIAVDFESREAVGRSRVRGGGRALVARALGLDRGVRTVVDATAGLGRDAWSIAVAGAEVTMVERNPVLLALLEDGLERARARGAEAAQRIELVGADAVAFLAALDERPDAVFLDPMFADRGKAALPGRDLQILRALLGPGGDVDGAELLAAARAVARRRVVVKRPAHAPAPAARPTATYGGGRIRYEVYAPDPGSSRERTSGGSPGSTQRPGI